MEDVVYKKRCGHRDCNQQPTFGKVGSKKAERCSEHAEDGMVNVVTKRCSHSGCDKRPSYGAPGASGRLEFCVQHSKEGMISLSNASRSSERGDSRGSGTAPRVDAGGKRRVCDVAATQELPRATRAIVTSDRRDSAEMPAARAQVAALRRDNLLPAQDDSSSKPGDAAVKAEVSVNSKMHQAGASRVEAVKKEVQRNTLAEDGLRSEPVAEVKPELGLAFPFESKSPGGESFFGQRDCSALGSTLGGKCILKPHCERKYCCETLQQQPFVFVANRQ